MTADGWSRLRFDEMAQVVTDRVDPAEATEDRYVGLEHLDPEDLTINRWGQPSDVKGSKYRVKAGQIIFGKRRFYQKKIAVAPFDCICSAHAMVLQERSEIVASGFLPYFMLSDEFVNRALLISEGSLSPTIKWKRLAEQEFAIPPLDRQRDFIESLRTVESAIRSAARCVAQSELLRASVWHDAQRRLGEIPSVKLGEVCAVDGRLVDPKVLPFVDLPHVAPDNIESGSGQLLEIRSAGEDGVISGKYPFTDQHVLYSKIRPNLRKVALPDFDGVCSADMYPLLPATGMDRRYLFFTLLSSRFSAYATDRSARSGIPKINRRDLLSYEFPLPSGETQRQILEDMDGIDSVLRLLGRDRTALTRVRARLFTILLEESTR